MQHARKTVLLLALIALALTACAGLGRRLEPPRVNLASISVQEIKAFEAVFLLDLRVHNSNDAALPVSGVDCDLEVDGRHLATGVSGAQTTIPPLSSETVRLTVYASSLGIARTILDRMQKSEGSGTLRKLDYTLTGRIHLGGRSPIRALPFSVQGELSSADLSRP